jgi:hypothetical protein
MLHTVYDVDIVRYSRELLFTQGADYPQLRCSTNEKASDRLPNLFLFRSTFDQQPQFAL